MYFFIDIVIPGMRDRYLSNNKQFNALKEVTMDKKPLAKTPTAPQKTNQPTSKFPQQPNKSAPAPQKKPGSNW